MCTRLFKAYVSAQVVFYWTCIYYIFYIYVLFLNIYRQLYIVKRHLYVLLKNINLKKTRNSLCLFT